MTLHRHDQLGSTNDEALRLAREGAPHGTIVTARQQSAGRGRQGRHWVSPPGNVAVSFLYRMSAFPHCTAARAAEIGFLAAVAVAEALDTQGASCRLKWPNDVLLQGAKIAGILVEMADGALIVGIGINVAHAPPDMPYPVTSLAAHGAPVVTEAVLQALIARIEQWLAVWSGEGFEAVRRAWLRRGPVVGQVLTARAGDTAVTGAFAGMAEDGALLLTTADGTRRVVAGEVVPG